MVYGGSMRCGVRRPGLDKKPPLTITQATALTPLTSYRPSPPFRTPARVAATATGRGPGYGGEKEKAVDCVHYLSLFNRVGGKGRVNPNLCWGWIGLELLPPSA
eukprot:scaffold16723_cov143-Isochrysis_galbana.AAC.1